MKKIKPSSHPLLDALRFVSLAQHDEGPLISTHCIIEYESITAFDGILAIGARIQEDLIACPNTKKFVLALERAGIEYQIVQVSPRRLLVRSEEFHAYVVCADRAALPSLIPDAPVTVVDDRLLIALAKVAPLASAKGQTVVVASIQLSAGSVIATNREVILEAWHGIELPTVLLPRVVVDALTKSKKSLASFGFSETTATFYFTDQSWIRTQLYVERWPNVKALLDVPVNPRPVPPELFNAAAKVAPFSENGDVYFHDGFVSSHPIFAESNSGSELKLSIEGYHASRSYRTANLALIAKHVITWDETSSDDATLFFGDNIRGAIKHVNYEKS